MTKQKKTALDKCIEHWRKHMEGFADCKRKCPLDKYCLTNNIGPSNPKCQQKLNEYWKKQATIPDGWGVVKEIYSFVKHDVVDWTTKIEMFIKDKLEEAGIEVE